MITEKQVKEVSSEIMELKEKHNNEQVVNPAAMLEKSLDALQNEGGFKFLRGLVRDIERMDPAKKASKNAFLSEIDYADTRKTMRDEIQVLISILDGDSKNPEEIIEKLNKERDNLQQLVGENLNIIHNKLKKLEIAYRTLSSFFSNAGQNKIDCITLMNVNKDGLKGESEDTQAVREEISSKYDRLSLKNHYSIVVLPGFLGDADNVRTWAETAFKNKVLLVTDYKDLNDFSDLKKQLEKAALQGQETKMGNVVMTANYLLGRKKSQIADEEDDLFIPGSAALAGRMSNTEDVVISQGAAGKKYGTLSNIKGAHLDLLKSEIASLIDLGVVPMVEEDGRTMAYSNKTLYNGNTLGLQEYTIVRVFDWIGKVLQGFFNDQAFIMFDAITKNNVKEAIHSFLSDIKGPGRLIEDYSLKDITKDANNDIHVSLNIKPFFAAKNFLIELTGRKGSVGADWEQKVN